MADYLHHLEQKLSEIDQAIENQKARLAGHDSDVKSHALEELAHLRLRHDNLVERINEAKTKGAEEWSELHTGFQEEMDGLQDTFEKWLTRFD